jgi:hypothetical protein
MFAYQTTSETSRNHDPSDGKGVQTYACSQGEGLHDRSPKETAALATRKTSDLVHSIHQ